jgi:hypothetical protein
MTAFARAVLLASLALPPLPAAAGDPLRAATPPAALRTGKERLSDKASDEQRVDDCKVPAARRTRTRPAACPWDFGS